VGRSLAERGSRRARRAAVLWALALLIGAACGGAAWIIQAALQRAEFYPLLALQGTVYDRGMTAVARAAPPGGPVAVLQVTERTRATLKSVPAFLPGVAGELRFRTAERAFHARVVEQLRRLGAAVIVFDVVFDEEEPRWDPHLAAAMRRHGRVVLAAADDTGLESDGRAERTRSLQPPTEALRAAAAGFGAANLPLDPDKTIRRFGWWSPGIHPETLEDTEIPALGVAAAAVFARADPGAVIRRELRPEGRFLTRPVRGFGRPDSPGFQSLIRFHGSVGAPAGPNSRLNYEDVFLAGVDPNVNEEYLRRHLEGRVVLIGDTTAAGQDIHRSPVLSPGQAVDSTQQMPGVEIQAHIVQTLLTGQYPTQAGDGARLLLVLATCLTMAAAARLLTPLPAILAALALGAALLWGSVALLARGGLWLEPVTALGGLVAAALCGTAFMYATEHRDRMQARRQLARHVGSGVAAKLADDEWPDLAGESVEITLMFSDLQGFTSLSETMNSRELCDLLNRYFGEVIFPIVDRYGGSTDKVMGDGLMAYFGWPARHPDHAARAIRCALEMQDRLTEWLERPENQGLPPLRTRIGLHTGEATIGEIGSGARAEFTVIGDVVNVASRLEGMNKEFGTVILISEATHLAAGPISPVTPRGVVTVRGRVEPLPVFSVDSALDKAAKAAGIESADKQETPGPEPVGATGGTQ
jgi:adenylate cyclase